MFGKLRSFLGKIRSYFLRNEDAPPPPQMNFQPYKEHLINIEYNKLFCDNIELFRPAGRLEGMWKIIFAKDPAVDALKSISDDNNIETRVRILAFNLLHNRGIINTKEVLGTVIEVGTEEGGETIAIYKDLRALYINAKSKSFSWDNSGNGAGVKENIQNILTISQNIIGKAERWTQPRQAPPTAGDFRISFLVADGFYIGEGRLSEIKNDAVASAIISQAGALMIALAKMNREAKSTIPANVSINTPNNSAPSNNAAGEILKIIVRKSGDIQIDNKIVTLREVESRISQLARKNGTVWFHREAGKEAPPKAMEVIKLTVRYKVPVSLSSKPDFSDTIDDEGNLVPRLK